MTKRTIIGTSTGGFLMLALVAAPACDHRENASASRSASLSSEPASSVPAAAASRTMPRAWETWLRSEVERVRSSRPELAAFVDSMEPRTTRAGFPRFIGPNLGQADALPLLLDRLENGDDAPELRAALVEALPRTGADFGPAAVDLLTREPRARVRAAWMHALRTVDGEDGLRGLEMGLGDRDAEVRAHAARMVSHRSDGARLAPKLIEATRDSDVGVRLAAARTLGALRVSEAADALAALTRAEDPELQLHGLKALERVAPERAREVSQRDALRSSTDPRLARLATRLSSE